ncbi:MFS transporter [Peribacillus sp. SCS-155]|uniref:MFS transporter n=1 Tax=Peribacillus sedimenti TaxID=3115297 RepID=UPI00390583EF
MHASTIYKIFMAASSFANATMFTTYALYYVNGLHFNPFQLLLVGTVLELTILIFETPTGVFADSKGRRFSVILGTAILGAAFTLEGLVPSIHNIFAGAVSLFAGILIAEIIRGFGETFISGAAEAWVTDELGDQHIGPVFLSAARYNQAAAAFGILTSVGLASIALHLPYIAGGVVYLSLAIFLFLYMKEHTISAGKKMPSTSSAASLQIFKSGITAVRRSQILMILLFTTLLQGAASEGFDRLWEAHFLITITFPKFLSLNEAVWFGIISITANILSFLATGAAGRYIDTVNEKLIVRTLTFFTVIKIGVIALFAFSGNFLIAFISYMLLSVAGTIIYPLYRTWLNQNIPNHARATVLSIASQFDALGQTAGGPLVGLAGTGYTIRNAIFISGLLQLPVLYLFYRAQRIQAEKEPEKSQRISL